jgi:hypothetical protein
VVDQYKIIFNTIVNYHISESDLNEMKANRLWPSCQASRDVHTLYKILTEEFLTKKEKEAGSGEVPDQVLWNDISGKEPHWLQGTARAGPQRMARELRPRRARKWDI